MDRYPSSSSLTICEINGELVTVDKLSDDRANETYGKLIGMVLRPLSFPAYSLLLGIKKMEEPKVIKVGEEPENQIWVFLPSTINYQRVTWHTHKRILAFISSPDQITISDFDEFSQMENPCTLSSEKQRDASIIQWRPNAGKVLCVACINGFCIWAANSSNTNNTSTSKEETQWSLAVFIPDPSLEPVQNLQNERPICAMSWCPNGRYLASAISGHGSFKVLDVSQGAWTIFNVFTIISFLKWSPTGDFLFAAMCDGTFSFYETNTWQVRKWSSTTRFATGASWSRDGRVVLVSFLGSSKIGSFHFSSKPPSLDVHFEQINALEMVSSTRSHIIDKIEWDGSGERLAVSFEGGNDIYHGLLAIYDTSHNFLLNSTSLIGFIRGPGKYPKPISFTFDNKFKQGSLLTVLWSSGFCCTYPLIFSSNRTLLDRKEVVTVKVDASKYNNYALKNKEDIYLAAGEYATSTNKVSRCVSIFK